MDIPKHPRSQTRFGHILRTLKHVLNEALVRISGIQFSSIIEVGSGQLNDPDSVAFSAKQNVKALLY